MKNSSKHTVNNDNIDFNQLFEYAPVACLVFTPNLNIVAVTNKYLQLTMTQKEEIIGKGLFEVFPDDPNSNHANGKKNLSHSLKKVIENKITDIMPIQRYDIRRPKNLGGEFEERYWTPINTPILNKNNEIQFIIHRVEDVTDYVLANNQSPPNKELQLYKKEIEALLYERTKERTRLNQKIDAMETSMNFTDTLLNGIFQGTQDIIAAYDTDFNLMYFNQSYEHEFNKLYHKNIHLGDNILNTIEHLPNDKAKINLLFSQVITDGQFKVIEEFGDKTWERQYYEVNYYPLKDKNQKIIGLFHIAQNITDRIIAEKKLKLNEKALKAANTELEAFSYSVSHDLRAPLRSIAGFSQIFEEQYLENFPDDAKHIFSQIRSSAKEMAELIDDLLLFSRLSRQKIEKSKVSMRDLFSSVFDKIVSSDKKNNIQFTIDDLPPCKADEALIRQVVINLVSNAIKYSSKTEQPKIHVGYHLKNNVTEYFIKDNGVGFDMKYENKLFKVFQRLHSSDDYEGTGVGLAIVKRIIKRHGGSIYAYSEIDKGAEFTFCLGEDDD